MTDIIAVDKTERHVFVGERDCHELCVTETHIYFYDAEAYLEGAEPEPLGDLEGTLVNVASMDEDPSMVCDDISQDLGYVMEIAEKQVNVCMFYIAQFRMEDKKQGAEIIRNLPTIVFKLMGRRPDLLASYPDALPYELDEATIKHQENLRIYQAQKMNEFWKNSGLFGESESTDADKKDDVVLPYGPNYQFTKDDIDYLMGSGGGYPDRAVDHDAFDFWTSLGFKEVRDSRVLLYKVRSKQ